ncbi:MAG TPA: FAD-dependent oxidoreductase [Prosthecobacter sp.]
MHKFLLLLLAAPALFAAEADVIIFGGTPAGISAGVVASREGASVIILEPTAWIGGMVTGGLCKSDVGKEQTIGGFPREFFARAAAAKPDTPMWYAEPSVNLSTFEAMLKESGVKVLTRQAIQSVSKEGARITSLTTTDGITYKGKVFVDASYEGDLMAGARVSYKVGREGRSQYGEGLAGYCPMPIRPRTVEIMESDCPSIGGKGPSYIHGTPVSIPALDSQGQPIFGVTKAPALEPGSADKLTQSYNFRICVTQRPDINIPFPKPAGYDPAKYELLLRLIQAFPGIRFGRLFHLGDVANGKYDLNAQGLFSTDYPGANTGYPDGDATTRARIWQDHVDFIQGMLWFLGHDERVPQSLRDQCNSWGLCKDEFADNNHWPYALYIREGRRMTGDYVMVQKDLQNDIFKDDSVGMGSFVIDCHIVQRIVAEDGTVRDEGSFPDAPALPYQIPYRSLTPKQAECENLLVPVCLSASHIAYCSLRMEPVYMAMGHASGLAAVMAVKAGKPVQQIDTPSLRAKLAEQKAVLELPEMASMVRSSKLPGIVMDEQEAERVGHWQGSTYGKPVDGSSRHDENAEKGAKSVIYTLKVMEPGSYEVRISYASAPNRASNVPVSIHHAKGTETLLVNQKKAPPVDGLFLSLGTFEFAKDSPAVITISNKDTNGIVGADAVQLLKK